MALSATRACAGVSQMSLPIVIVGVLCQSLPSGPDVLFSLVVFVTTSQHYPHPPVLPSTRDLTGGQEAFANTPFNAHFSESNGGAEGKSMNCRNCSFRFLWFHNFCCLPVLHFKKLVVSLQPSSEGRTQ